MSVDSSKIALIDDNNARACFVRDYLDPEEQIDDMLNLNRSYFSARSISTSIVVIRYIYNSRRLFV